MICGPPKFIFARWARVFMRAVCYLALYIDDNQGQLLALLAVFQSEIFGSVHVTFGSSSEDLGWNWIALKNTSDGRRQSSSLFVHRKSHLYCNFALVLHFSVHMKITSLFFVINTSSTDRKITFNQSQLTSFTAHVSSFHAKNIDSTIISFKKLLNFLVFLSYGFIPEGSILAFIALDVKLIVQRENLVFSVLNFLELIGKIVSLSAHCRSQVGYSSSRGVMGCWTRLLAWYRTWDWFVFKCT